MKKLMVAIASAVAIGFSAYAGNEAWFDAGVDSAWPNSTAMNGSWSNVDQASWDSSIGETGALVIEATNELAFTANPTKTFGTDAQTLTYTADIEFFPFEAVPSVPENAKAGICVVSNSTTEFFYVLAKDGENAANVWTATTIPAAYGEVAVSINVTSPGSTNVSAVTYTIGDSSYSTTIYVSGTEFSGVAFTGDGTLTSLKGEVNREVTLTLPTLADKHLASVAVFTNGDQQVAVSGGTCTLLIGTAYTLQLNAADGYLFSDGKNYVMKEYAAINGNVDLNDTWSESDNPQTAKVKVIGGSASTYYMSLAAAVADAQDGDYVEICDDTYSEETLTGMLAIDRAITINLKGLTITLPTPDPSGDNIGIHIASDVAISNGYIVSGHDTDVAYSKAIYIDRSNVVLKDLELNLTHFEYGIDQESNLETKTNYWSKTPEYSLTCENVDVIGNGSLFHLENTVATLDADCSASKDDETTCFGNAHDAAIYFSCGSKVTVNGGSYSSDTAIQTGYLGGDIDIKGGTFSGTIKSLMNETYCVYDGNHATIAISGGDFTGAFSEWNPKPTSYNTTTWAITGGTFLSDPTAYLAEGYRATWNATSGRYEISVQPVAKIGDKEYTTLKAAVDALTGGETITLLSNATTKDLAGIAVNCTLDLNGKTLSVDTAFASSANVSIMNGDQTAGGLTVNGAITVTANKLDLSGLGWGVGGITPEQNGSLNITASGAEVAFAAGVTPNWMKANNANFFASTVNGAKVTMGSTTYTYNGTLFAVAGAVATATVEGTGSQAQALAYTETYATLAAAREAVKANGTLTLLADIEGAGTFALDKAFTFDLNGKTLHIANGDVITVNAAITFANSNATAGKGIKNDGTINVNEDLNLSTLSWTTGGLVGSTDKTAKFVIKAEKALVFAAGNNPNAMEANLPGFLSGSENGAKFVNGDDHYTFYTVSAYWALGVQTVPTAKENLVYDGTAQTGVEAALNAQYTLTDNVKTDAGNYTAKAALNAEYVWENGTTNDAGIAWSIAANTVATVTVSLDQTIAEYAADLQFPAATATIDAASVNGTTNWNPAVISAPSEGATNEYVVTFTVTDANYAGSTGTATFKVYKNAAGPTPASGNKSTVDPVTDPSSGAVIPNTYKVEPTAENTDGIVAVGGVKSGDTLVVDGSTVNGIGVDNKEGVTIKVQTTANEVTYDITGACKGWGTGSDANKFDTALDDTVGKKVDVKVDETTYNIPVTPTIGDTSDNLPTIVTPFVVGDTTAATIATIPGLKYQLKRGTSIGTYDTAASGDPVAATGATMTLTDTTSTKPTDKAFYVIEVTK